MQDTKAKVLLNTHYKGDYFLMNLETGWDDYVPGQFIMVEVPGTGTLLRRPFGMARLREGVVEICYKLVGKGTHELAKVPVGAETHVLGPIGRGFDITKASGKKALLVAGGYGVAPLLGLAGSLKENGDEVHLFYGARTADHLLYVEEFEKVGVHIHIATEDGSKGEKGLVTDSLNRVIKSATSSVIFACGPHQMLSAVKKVAMAAKNVAACELSLEAYMGCGIGVCVGCVVKDSAGEYVRVCKEGPVFEAASVNI